MELSTSRRVSQVRKGTELSLVAWSVCPRIRGDKASVLPTASEGSPQMEDIIQLNSKCWLTGRKVLHLGTGRDTLHFFVLAFLQAVLGHSLPGLGQKNQMHCSTQYISLVSNKGSS